MNIINFEWYKEAKEHTYWFDDFSKYEIELMTQQALRVPSQVDNNSSNTNKFHPYSSEAEYKEAVKEYDEEMQQYRKDMKLYNEGTLSEIPPVPWPSNIALLNTLSTS